MITSQELQDIMSNCYGTEHYYKFALIPTYEIFLTDGVKTFVDNADAFWFLSDFYSYIPTIRKKAPNEYLFVVTLEVKEDETADLIITDGNNNPIVKKHYTYTDCPAGEWKFYFNAEDKVMLYFMEW